MPNYIDTHPGFHLNGISLNRNDLVELAYSFVKEGQVFEQVIGDFLLEWLNSDSTLTVETSGSTGKPKRILLEKEKMINSALATGTFFNLSPGDSALHCLSSNFIAGKMMLVRAVALGLRLDCVEPNSSPLKNNTKVYDFAAMVPMQLQSSLAFIDKIDRLIVGGAPISSSLVNEVQGRQVKIFETYGMTETITHIAVKKINDRAPINEKHTKNFVALPDVKFATDKRGCLVINAPRVSDFKVVTNDIVELISGTEFKWLGRYDNVINSGGVKLIPEQIESAFEKVISNRFFVFALPDKKLGEKLVLLVEGQIDKETIQHKIESIPKLDKFWYPKEIFSIPHFTETKNGKVHRSKTKAFLKKAE